MRDKLETELLNMLSPYRKELPFEDIRAQVTIILSEYEVTKRNTELAIMNEDKNNRFIAMFIASKAAGGRTEKTLHAYKNYLIKILDVIRKDADQITADDIKLYLAKKLRVDNCSKVSVDNERRTLSSFYGWMLKNEHINKNPMDKVEVMKYQKPKKHAFTEMEVEMIRGGLQVGA